MVRWIAALLLLCGCLPAKNEGQVPQQMLPKPAAFDGKRAMGYLKAICDIGPRISGTEGMKKQQELLRKHFADLGLKVTMQSFRAKQLQRKEIDMANMIVSFAPEKTKRIILCSHYDTRPIADQEKDFRKWHDPFVSANDGGSGVALLMELAHHLKDLKMEVGVDLVFFDGEEYIWRKAEDWEREEAKDKYFFGSEHFAKTWQKSDPRPDYRAAVLLDMIGGKNAEFPMERGSLRKAEELCEEIWRLAGNLKIAAFKDEVTRGEVLDDHLALQKAGIPAIDIIDFSYTHWHQLTDTPENCAADSLANVATVLSVWIQRVK